MTNGRGDTVVSRRTGTPDPTPRRPRCCAALVVLGGLLAASLTVVASPAAGAPGDVIIYGVSAYGFDEIVEINLTQGTSTRVDDIGRPTQAADQDPVTERVYFYEWQTSAYYHSLDAPHHRRLGSNGAIDRI